MQFLHLLLLICSALFSGIFAQASQADTVVDKRQNGNANTNTDTTVTAAQTTSQTSNTRPDSTNSAAATTDTSGITSVASSSSTATNSKQALTTAKTIAQNAPAGGISMISPAATTTTYYKIGQNITFVWNYTSLLAPPSAINILVSNTASTYTLTQNASVQATATYIWDTDQYNGQQNPLINAFYTMAVFDAAGGYTAVPKPGHLGANGLNRPFGIYATQTPSVTNVMDCVTCSSAVSLLEQKAVRLLLATVAVLSLWLM